ncbi:hypothetical protein ERJ75_001037400 [Trypanosoma vivax]|nr:hypothetical protein ERJ75_001037400 [Trypanosoma vivax]
MAGAPPHEGDRTAVAQRGERRIACSEALARVTASKAGTRTPGTAGAVRNTALPDARAEQREEDSGFRTASLFIRQRHKHTARTEHRRGWTGLAQRENTAMGVGRHAKKCTHQGNEEGRQRYGSSEEQKERNATSCALVVRGLRRRGYTRSRD